MPAAIEAASPRASATVAMMTNATDETSASAAGPLARSVSPSTVTPSTPATTGLATVMVGRDEVSAPARKADCWKTIPHKATSSHGTNSGMRSTPPGPLSATSTTPFVSTANSASDEPATTASSIAATGRPFQIRAPSTHSTSVGPITAATIIHVDSEARC